MTQNLSSGSPAGTPKSHSKAAGRGDGAGGGRNCSILDYFKPSLNQEKRNGKAGLSVSHTEHLRKSILSPKRKRRKKLPIPPPNQSPIIEAFLRGAKSEKKDCPDNGIFMTSKVLHPKAVARQLFTTDGSSDCSFILKDNICTKNLEKNEISPIRTRTPLVENSRECNMDYMELDTAGSGLTKWASTAENDSLKKDNHTYYQKMGCLKIPQFSPISSSSQLLSEVVCRERQVKEKKMLSKQQPFDSVKKSLEVSFSNQDTRGVSTKRSDSTSRESSSAESSSMQASEAEFPSGWDSDEMINMRKSQTCPSVHPDSIPLLGVSKHKEYSRKRKRKSLETDLKKSKKSNVQRFEKHNFSSSLEKHNSDCSKNRMSPHVDLQVEVMTPPDSNLPLSIEYIDTEENGYNSMDTTNKDCQIQITDAKESQLQTFPKFYLEKVLPLFKKIDYKSIKCQEKIFSKQSTESESHIRHNSSSEALKRTVHPPLTSTLPSENNSEHPVLLGDNVLSSEDLDFGTISSSSSDLNEGSNPRACILNRKPSHFCDSDVETSDSNMDSSDEEILLPLDQILAQSARPSAENPEQRNDESGKTDTMSPSQKIPLFTPSVKNAHYMNHLEDILKEKEAFRRIDELEKQLQQVKWEVPINCQPEEDSDDGELSAEHREFLERFALISDAIPDQHPGENIFHVVHTGKIFSHLNLDLRNSGFHPQNPIEKYILGSGITQQLFVISEGLLLSAYYSSPCPVPILKWMFRMMSIHPDSSLSRKILDILMSLTIKTASASNDQPRPWIPSIFDIATVLLNMGVPFSALFPLQDFQPNFSEEDIISEMHETIQKKPSGDIFGNSVPIFHLIDTNLCNMSKFLRLCISMYPEGYTDKEIFMLLLLLLKLSLAKELKQFPLVDLECLVIKLLENIREWDTKMPELCRAISYLSSHHHDLLGLVQFVPNWMTRGRQIRRHLSLVVILKLLKTHVKIPSSHDQQMSLLCKELVNMKPSNLLKRISETVGHHDGLKEESFLRQYEPEAYYLAYVLLHLVREASNSEVTNSNHREWLVKLCTTLEKHVKCDIREDVRLFYKTKVKDLVARTYSKWQQMIHSSRLTQGQIHDFWVPDASNG
ncbi:SMC5-SMC6 complex localization factor protein 2 isoform X1 [Podarcis muralis]